MIMVRKSHYTQDSLNMQNLPKVNKSEISLISKFKLSFNNLFQSCAKKPIYTKSWNYNTQKVGEYR